jgi:hypothetical protein
LELKAMAQEGFTTDQLAKLLGVSAQSVNEAARKGIIVKTGRGTFPIRAVAQYVAHLHAVIRGTGSAGLTKEREAYLAEKTKLARLQRLEAEGVLIEKQKVVDAYAHVKRAERDLWLSLPTRAAPALANRPTPEVFAVLMQYVCDLLEGLANVEFTADDEEEAADVTQEAADDLAPA